MPDTVAPAAFPAVFALPRTLAWGECDPAGIIYYPTYYRWMDTAAWEMLAACGYGAQRMRDEGFTIPLVNAQCDFIASPAFGDACEVRTQLAKHGRSSFTLAQEVVRSGGDRAGEVLARGSESRVWCRYQAGPGSALRSDPLPADLLSAWK